MNIFFLLCLMVAWTIEVTNVASLYMLSTCEATISFSLIPKFGPRRSGDGATLIGSHWRRTTQEGLFSLDVSARVLGKRYWLASSIWSSNTAFVHHFDLGKWDQDKATFM